MPEPSPDLVEAHQQTVWRVGRFPDPWAWTPREFSGSNRWDDAANVFRTIYVGETAFACFVEILAFARPDVVVDQPVADLAGIVEDEEDGRDFPTPPPGVIHLDWLLARQLAQARMTGQFIDVRTSATTAWLRPRFLVLASALGHSDLDQAAIKSSSPRALTQAIASFLYGLVEEAGAPAVDGIRFASRHGDELALWAIFERPGDEPTSRRIEPMRASAVDPEDPDLHKALRLHDLVIR